MRNRAAIRAEPSHSNPVSRTGWAVPTTRRNDRRGDTNAAIRQIDVPSAWCITMPTVVPARSYNSVGATVEPARRIGSPVPYPDTSRQGETHETSGRYGAVHAPLTPGLRAHFDFVVERTLKNGTLSVGDHLDE